MTDAEILHGKGWEKWKNKDNKQQSIQNVTKLTIT